MGQMEVRLHTLNTRTQAKRTVEAYFQFIEDGKLSQIQQLSPPPFYSDEAVKAAFERNVISESEFSYLREIPQTDRFLVWETRHLHQQPRGSLARLNVDRIRDLGERIHDPT